MIMELTKEQANNIINLMQSVDEENHYIAFKSIESFDYKDGKLGYLIYFFKFSKYSAEDWKTQCPMAYNKILSVIDNINAPLTYARALSIMLSKRLDKESIELFLERHVKDLENTLTLLGYPLEYLNFEISLK